MTVQTENSFTSADLAKEARKRFGDKVRTVQAAIDPVVVKEVESFIGKIHKAHRDAANSTLIFR